MEINNQPYIVQMLLVNYTVSILTQMDIHGFLSSSLRINDFDELVLKCRLIPCMKKECLLVNQFSPQQCD